MTSELKNTNAGTQRTRRNIMKMGAILGPMVVLKAQSASAGPLCKTFLGPLLPWCDPGATPTLARARIPPRTGARPIAS
jgi:hypothetical protein